MVECRACNQLAIRESALKTKILADLQTAIDTATTAGQTTRATTLQQVYDRVLTINV
jgi:hypothetical protein